MPTLLQQDPPKSGAHSNKINSFEAKMSSHHSFKQIAQSSAVDQFAVIDEKTEVCGWNSCSTVQGSFAHKSESM